jgi:translation initiation factor 4G
MTSIPQQSNISAQTSITEPQPAAQKQYPSVLQGPISTALSVGRSSYAAATKGSVTPNASGSFNMATAMKGSVPSQHSNGDVIPPVNGNIPIIAAIPSLEASAGINGNNNLSAGAASDHSRKPSFTVTPSGINGGPPGNQPNKTINIQFGSTNVGGSPASGASPALADTSPANLGVGGPVNPRAISPQPSPSPIPQPSISGGRPPSSLQNQGNNLIFGQSGPESNDPSVYSFLANLYDDRILTIFTATHAWSGTKLICAWWSKRSKPTP